MLYEDLVDQALALYEQVEKKCGGNDARVQTIVIATILLNQKQTNIRYLHELRCALTEKKKNEKIPHKAR